MEQRSLYLSLSEAADPILLMVLRRNETGAMPSFHLLSRLTFFKPGTLFGHSSS
jgi:hypothetical protein